MPNYTFHTPINDVATFLSVAHVAGDGELVVSNVSLFGTPSVSSPVRVTVTDGTNLFICSITGKTGSTLLIGGFLEGTSDVGMDIGSSVEVRMTAGDLLDVQQAINSGFMMIGNEVSDATPKSILYVDASGNLAQDNANFVWDATNHRLGIDTTSPRSALDVTGIVTLGDPSFLHATINSNDGFLFNADRLNTGTVDGSFHFAKGRTGASGGTEFLTILSTGQVGIGTTSPARTLHVKGTANQYLKLEGGGTTSDVAMELTDGTNTVYDGLLGGAAGSGIWGVYNSGVRLIVNQSGQVGVGSVGSGTTLGGQLQVNITTAATKGVIVKAVASQSANLLEAQNSSGTALVLVDSIGRVGIGATPADGIELLKIANNKVLAWSFANPASGSAFFIKADSSDQGAIFTSSYGKPILIDGSSVLLNANSTGLVGIGETSPGAQLQVKTNAASTKGLIVKGAASQSANLLEVQSSTGSSLLSLNPTGTQLIFGGASGGVIFNPTATSYVQFDGTNVEVVSPANMQFRTGAAYLFKNFAGTSEWMRIDATGKVGIGTSSPSFTFDVFKDTGALASPAARIGNAQGALGMTAIAYLDGGSNSDDSGGYVAFRSGGATDAVHLGWARRSSVMGLEVLTTSNTSLMRVGTDGKVGINETSPGAQLQINTSSASTKGVIVKGTASQSANLIEVQSSSGTALFVVGPGGDFTFGPNGTLQFKDTGGGNYRIVGNAITALDQSTFLVRNAAGTSTYLTISASTGYSIFSGPVGINENNPSGQIQVTTPTAGSKGLILKGLPNRTINNVSLTSNVATITTTAAHNFLTGNAVVISGLTNSVLNGTYTISSTPTTTTFTFAKTNANITSVADSGTASVAQTANLQEWQDGAGSVLASISPAGAATFTGALASTGPFSQLTVSRRDNSAQAAAIYSGSGDFQVFMGGAGGDTFVIKSTGAVGIGATPSSPGAQLQVATLAAATKGLIVKGFTSQTANLFEAQNSLGTALVTIDASGKLGVGTTPTTPLHVLTNTTSTGNNFEQLRLEQAGTGDVGIDFLLSGVTGYRMGIDNSDGDKFKIGTSEDLGTSTALTINTGGAIGIGDSSPGAQLQVTSSSAATKGLIVKGFSSQSATLQEWQDSSGATLASVTPKGELSTKGIISPIVSKTSAYTITQSDDMVVADATSGAFTVTLPNATTVGDGREFTVKKIDSSANAVTIGTTSSQTIDGATTKALSAQWTSITVKALSGAWYIK